MESEQEKVLENLHVFATNLEETNMGLKQDTLKLNAELGESKVEHSRTCKLWKNLQKENHNLSKTVDNLKDNVKDLKAERVELRSAKSKAESDRRRLEKNKIKTVKSRSVETQTDVVVCEEHSPGDTSCFGFPQLDEKHEPVQLGDTDKDLNANETKNLEESFADILHTVPIKNSFQHLLDFEDDENLLKVCTASPIFTSRSSAASPLPSTTHSTQPPGDPGAASGALDLSAARSPHTANTAASSSGQWGLVKAENQASTEQKFRNLWKCEFCEQTYNRQNTFDQVYHTFGHQKKT